MTDRVIASVGCARCEGGCVLCLGVRGRQPITFRSVLAHRQTFQDSSSGQQSSPIRPALSDCAPTQALGSGKVSGRSNDPEIDLNSVVVHAPIIEQEHEACPTDGRLIP